MVLFSFVYLSAFAKDKPPVETGAVSRVEYVRVELGWRVVLYTVHGEGVEFEAHQYPRTAFSDYPKVVANVGDTVRFQMFKNVVVIQDKRMLLVKSTRRPK